MRLVHVGPVYAGPVHAGSVHAGLALGIAAVIGCSGNPPPKLPLRELGCEVVVYRGGVPDDVNVIELGPVAAFCGKNDADSDCIRALQDEVCKLGGNVVYEVPAKPEEESDATLHYTGVAGTDQPATSNDKESTAGISQ